jgi:hypothetical protein
MTGVNPAIFQDLQARVDEDTAVRDVRSLSRPRSGTREHALTTRQELKDIIQALEKQSKFVQEPPKAFLILRRS